MGGRPSSTYDLSGRVLPPDELQFVRRSERWRCFTMQFRDRDYYRASLDRMRQAQALSMHGDAYALSMYCSGLAVECLLRAFRWREDNSFEGRHDLTDLLKASGMVLWDSQTKS